MTIGTGFLAQLTRNFTPGQWARHCAYLVAPSLVLGFGLSGVYSRGLVFDLAGPVAVTELRSEIQPAGEPIGKNGVMVTLDGSPAEARIPLVGSSGRAWSSLSVEELAANRDHLKVENGVLLGKTPLLGISGSSTIVVEGSLKDHAFVEGGTETFDALKLPQARVTSVLASVLLASVFAFGMALASSGQPAPNQNRSRKIAT